MVSSANMAFGMYPGLSHGAYSALFHHGSDDLKQTYLPKPVTGEWTGPMNLTEPQCGTDLRLLRTKAIPPGDGRSEETTSQLQSLMRISYPVFCLQTQRRTTH